jgi:uncharacterized protein YciI
MGSFPERLAPRRRDLLIGAGTFQDHCTRIRVNNAVPPGDSAGADAIFAALPQTELEPMMLFAIHCLDRKGAAPKREEFYAAHRAHQDNGAAFGVDVVMGGPLVADDGKTALGSLIVVEAQDRAAAEAFNRADPFRKNGVWERVDVNAYLKRRG